jgi:integrase/recombinase XerD
MSEAPISHDCSRTVLQSDVVFAEKGRRTFITKAAKRCIEGGGSLGDVQQLAGHSSLATTQRYIEGSSDAKRRIVDLIS